MSFRPHGRLAAAFFISLITTIPITACMETTTGRDTALTVDTPPRSSPPALSGTSTAAVAITTDTGSIVVPLIDGWCESTGATLPQTDPTVVADTLNLANAKAILAPCTTAIDGPQRWMTVHMWAASAPRDTRLRGSQTEDAAARFSRPTPFMARIAGADRTVLGIRRMGVMVDESAIYVPEAMVLLRKDQPALFAQSQLSLETVVSGEQVAVQIFLNSALPPVGRGGSAGGALAERQAEAEAEALLAMGRAYAPLLVQANP